jgi:putative phosphoesterase
MRADEVTGGPLTTTRIAVLSDIHGNRWALEAVLSDIRRRHIKRIVNLGDCLYGPLDPAGTARILMKSGWPTVCGNEDRIIVEHRETGDTSSTLQYVREDLGSAQLEWLRSLSMTAVVDETFFLCHGSPRRDTEYLLVEVSEQAVSLRSSQALLDLTAGIEQPVLLCGHDHIPRTVRIPNGKLIVNPGSVGLPVYQDEWPYPHVMEAGHRTPGTAS